MSSNKQIYLWFGDNDYGIHEKAADWAAKFEKKHGRFNFFSFDLDNAYSGRDQLLVDLKTALQTDSLFGQNKFVVLRNFLSSKANLSEEMSALLIKAVKDDLNGHFLVFIQTGKPDSRTEIAKALKAQEKSGRVEVKEFFLLRPFELTKWAGAKAREYGAVLTPAMVERLINLVWSDLWQLDNEILKLVSYCAGRPITVDDIEFLVKGKYNDNIFQLTDAISQKNKKQALKLFQDQLDSGANEFYLLTMLVREFRILWQVKDLSEKQLSVEEISTATGIASYPVQKAIGHCRQFTFEAIKKIFNRLLEIEIKLKTSRVSFETLFDLLVSDL